MHPDLPSEQAYFDRALALRDRQQAGWHAPRLAANPKAAIELRKRVSKLGLADPDEAIAFGRIEAADDRWYIGKGAIWDDDNDLVVVNWQAPIAAPFYTATPTTPRASTPAGCSAARATRSARSRTWCSATWPTPSPTAASPSPCSPTPCSTPWAASARASWATSWPPSRRPVRRHQPRPRPAAGGAGRARNRQDRGGLHRVSWLLFNRRDRLEATTCSSSGPTGVRALHLGRAALARRGGRRPAPAALGPQVRVGRVRPAGPAPAQGRPAHARLILAACATASRSTPRTWS